MLINPSNVELVNVKSIFDNDKYNLQGIIDSSHINIYVCVIIGHSAM